MSVLVWAGGEHFGSSEVMNWPYALAWVSVLGATIAAVFLLIEFLNPHELPKKSSNYKPLNNVIAQPLPNAKHLLKDSSYTMHA